MRGNGRVEFTSTLSGIPAVILAAGRGERLRYHTARTPKPTLRLLGLSLLERTVLACREAGISECYVIVGHQGDVVAQHAEEVQRRAGIPIHIVENPHWRDGNGTSVLAAAPYLERPFLLLMCDHLFEPDLLRQLLRANVDEDECLLAVDSAPHPYVDVREATKVRLNGQHVVSIGKDVSEYDAVDAGAFLCTPTVFEALERAWAEGDGSLSAGMRRLADMGRLRAVDIHGYFWFDVDTPEDLSRARQLLLAGAGKPQADGPISRRVNRPISRRLTAWLAETPLTPNAITVLSFTLAVLAALFFMPGRFIWNMMGGLLVQLASIVDGCDGEIARLKFMRSQFGGWFDTVLDRYADVAVATGIIVGFARHAPGTTTWLLGILAATGFVMFSYTKKEYQVQYSAPMPPHPWYDRVPASRDVRLFILFVGGLLNIPYWALLVSGGLAHLSVALRLAAIYTAERALSRTQVSSAFLSPLPSEGTGLGLGSDALIHNEEH